MKTFEELEYSLTQVPQRRLAVVSSDDEHTIDAVMKAAARGLVTPIFLGNAKKTEELLEELGHVPSKVEIIDVESPEKCAASAMELVRAERADCLMKGRIETGTLMKAVVNRETGIRNQSVMSAFGLFQTPYYHKVFAITDMGLNIAPTLEEKKVILRNAVDAMHRLGISCPKVAVLAAVEIVNPKMPETMDAEALANMVGSGELTGCQIAGPISGDLAMSKESAEIKRYENPVAGDADLLLMPDIAAGNIASKLLCCVGGGQTCGVMLGAKVPLISLSRGASAYEKYMSILLGACIGRASDAGRGS